jgi:RHS repeat-associated protein
MTGCCCTSCEERADFSQSAPEIERCRSTSKEYDEETGLHYMSARYINPVASRWMSSDPAGWELINPMQEDDNGEFQMRSGFSIVESMNPYSYCSNNPVKYNDPNGMQSTPMPHAPCVTRQDSPSSRPAFKSPIAGLKSNMITSPFGLGVNPLTGGDRMHRGVDIGVPEGTNVKAALSGKVTKVDFDNVYGNYIEIEHSNGYSTKYGHLADDSITVKKGDSVSTGDQIGLSGNTGGSTGPHLHFEIKHNDTLIDPLPIIKPEES